MTDHHHETNRPSGPPPTAKQQRYLRRLALERGVSFTPPRTRREASSLIDEMRRRRPELHSDRRRELRDVQADLATGHGDAARIRDDEITGYGSSATWKQAQR